MSPKTPPCVIDLFSGVGGLSLGAARAGFRVAAGVESDAIASAFHAINFPATRHLKADVRGITGKDLAEASGQKVGTVEGLIGGPPCQGFSLIGRREPSDPRNELFSHFFRLVSELRPAFYVAENVSGILAPANQDVIDAAEALLPKQYVRLPPLRVEANRYGAPTTRTRIFFIGYDAGRFARTTLGDLNPPEDVPTTLVRDAFEGLGQLRSNWRHETESWRRVGQMGESRFACRVANCVPVGVGDSVALNRFRNKREVSGFLGTLHDPATVERFEKLRPGEVDPIYRSPRLKLDGFCPTLRAGTGPDKGSFQAVRPIHPTRPRVISPREAARLQGFPDWFVFHPTKWHAFRQIGNSVSPLVAELLLAKLFSKLI